MSLVGILSLPIENSEEPRIMLDPPDLIKHHTRKEALLNDSLDDSNSDSGEFL